MKTQVNADVDSVRRISYVGTIRANGKANMLTVPISTAILGFKAGTKVNVIIEKIDE